MVLCSAFITIFIFAIPIASNHPMGILPFVTFFLSNFSSKLNTQCPLSLLVDPFIQSLAFLPIGLVRVLPAIAILPALHIFFDGFSLRLAYWIFHIFERFLRRPERSYPSVVILSSKDGQNKTMEFTDEGIPF